MSICWLVCFVWLWFSEGISHLFFQFVFVVGSEKKMFVVSDIFGERPVAGCKVGVHMEWPRGGNSGDVRVVISIRILPWWRAFVQVQVN